MAYSKSKELHIQMKQEFNQYVHFFKQKIKKWD